MYQTARESGFGHSNRAAAAASNVVSVGVNLSSLSRYQSLTNAEQGLNSIEFQKTFNRIFNRVQRSFRWLCAINRVARY